MLEKEELNKIHEKMVKLLKVINGFIEIILNENQHNEIIQRYGTFIKEHINEAEKLNSTLYSEDTCTNYDVIAIDDDNDALYITKSVFNSQNRRRKKEITLKCVNDTNTADNELDRYIPKVILLDINLKRRYEIDEGMPPEVKDGRVYCRKLKNNNRFRDIKIFLLTNHEWNLDQMKEEANADGIFTKPFTTRKFKLIEGFL